MIAHNGKKQATTGPKRPHRQNENIGNHKEIMDVMQVKGERGGDQETGEMRLLSKLYSNLLGKILAEGAVTTEVRYFTTLTEKATHFFRRWVLPCSTLQGCCVEWEGEKQVGIHIRKTREYLEFSNQISPKSSGPVAAGSLHSRDDKCHLPVTQLIFEFALNG